MGQWFLWGLFSLWQCFELGGLLSNLRVKCLGKAVICLTLHKGRLFLWAGFHFNCSLPLQLEWRHSGIKQKPDPGAYRSYYRSQHQLADTDRTWCCHSTRTSTICSKHCRSWGGNCTILLTSLYFYWTRVSVLAVRWCSGSRRAFRRWCRCCDRGFWMVCRFVRQCSALGTGSASIIIVRWRFVWCPWLSLCKSAGCLWGRRWWWISQRYLRSFHFGKCSCVRVMKKCNIFDCLKSKLCFIISKVVLAQM